MSGSHCLVLGCRNRQLINQTKSYYRFPRDANFCKLWVDFCGRPELYKKLEENGSEYLYKSSRVCSDHFKSSDFNNPNLYSQGLKKGSVPSVNPPCEPTPEALQQPAPRRSLLQTQRRPVPQLQTPRSLPPVLQMQRRPVIQDHSRSILHPLKRQKISPKLRDEYGYGINYVDMDDPDGSDYKEPQFKNSIDDEYKVFHNPKPSSAATTPTSSLSNNGNMNFKEKYEQTLKELFACRKIVKNQNNAIKQLQGEIDFLNQLLKEK